MLASTGNDQNEHCLLCQEQISKYSLRKDFKIESNGELPNRFGGNIDLIVLCDILKVSINAAENYFKKTVALCWACDTDVSEINEIFRKIKELKQNSTIIMKSVKRKLHESLGQTTSTSKDGQSQFTEIRQEILFDLSNILGIPESQDNSIEVKIELRHDSSESENNDWNNCDESECENQPEINSETIISQSVESAKIIRSAETSQKVACSQNTTNQNTEKYNGKTVIPSIPSSNSTPNLSNLFRSDIPDDGDQQQAFDHGSNFDPDFTEDISSDDGDDSNDEASSGTRKRKPGKNSSSERMRKNISRLQKKSDDVLKPGAHGDTPNQGSANVGPTEIGKKIIKMDSDQKYLKHDTVKSIGKYRKRTNIEKKFECDLCRRLFTTIKSLKTHKKLYHSGTDKKMKPKTACEICGRLVGNIVRHIKEVHGEKEDLTLKCPHCTNVYKAWRGYNEHLLTHSEQFTPYVCSYCGKSFLTGPALVRHERFHVEEKTFECEICHKKFNTNSALKAHMDFHSTENKYVCETCGKSFKYSGHLRAHLIDHKMIEEKGEIARKCKYCDKTFKSRSGRRKHESLHHPK